MIASIVIKKYAFCVLSHSFTRLPPSRSLSLLFVDVLMSQTYLLESNGVLTDIIAIISFFEDEARPLLFALYSSSCKRIVVCCCFTCALCFEETSLSSLRLRRGLNGCAEIIELGTSRLASCLNCSFLLLDSSIRNAWAFLYP